MANRWLALAGLMVVVGCGGGSGSAAPTQDALAPTITVQPVAQTVAVGQSATFAVTVTGTAPLTYQWQLNGTNISGAAGASYATPATVATDDGAMYDVTITNSAGSATSATVRLTVTPAVTAAATDVLTYHNDNARTGQNLTETILTPTTVSATQFGLLRTLSTDGLVDGQPLIVSNLTVGGHSRNVLFIVTEHDSVYSFDADDGTPLVQVSLLGAGETTSDNHQCSQVTPEIGITSTPVIDRSAGTHGTLFAVAMSKASTGHYIQRVHALDLTTLAEQAHSPVVVQATYPGTGAASSAGTMSFDPGQYKERVGLLLVNNTLYTAWASHCDGGPYTGWVMGYNESSLAQVSVLDVVPNGSDGAIWQAGGGMAADSSGNLYALIANGTFDTTLDANGMPSKGDYGNAFVKIATTAPMKVSDYFAMSNATAESAADIDLGSGAPMLLPDQTDSGGTVRHLAVGAGKDGHLYVVNRDGMGKFMTTTNGIWQDLSNALPGGIWSAPAYFHGKVYFADVNGSLKAFAVTQAKLGATPASVSSNTFAYPGASPSVSANGTSNGIVWAVESNKNQAAVLHAYDAEILCYELYNTNQAAAGRDHFGNGNKYITPTVSNGKVYVGTPTGVAVFGPRS